VDAECGREALPLYVGMARVNGADYAWGRARDRRLAYDKAIAEAIERFACVRTEGLYRAAFRELKGALDPREVVAYAPENYRRRGFPFVLFDEKRKVLWKDGVDLASGRKTPVLADLVYFERALRKGRRTQYTAATSSGVAAFPQKDKALERAVLELVERDAAMRAWLSRRGTPRIPHASLPRAMQRRVSALNRMGFRVVVKNLTEDLATVILVFAQHARRGFTAIGTAADYEAEAALDHALMECEAMAILRLRGGAARRVRPARVSSPSDHAELYAQRRYFRRADFLAAGRETARLAPRGRRKAAGTWSELLSRLERKGRRVIAVDLTPPGAALDGGKVALSVVRAIVPGLVPLWFGAGMEPSLHALDGERPSLPHPFP
jgi:ribosomal protein S12 methylthiotransferase accessory factor